MQRETFTFNGVATQMLRTGAGQRVIFLHGSADSPQAWQTAMMALAGEFECLAPQLPPLSGAVQYGRAFALDADLPWLTALLDQTGARILAGHSYGALLALRWALAHRGRLDTLLLCEPIAWGIARSDPQTAAKLAELETLCVQSFGRGQAESAMQWLVDFWNGDGFWAQLPERVRASLLAGAPRTCAEVSSGGADHTDAIELADLHARTLLMAGEFTPRESLTVSRRLADAIAGARLAVVGGAGHQFLRSHGAHVAAQLRNLAITTI